MCVCGRGAHDSMWVWIYWRERVLARVWPYVSRMQLAAICHLRPVWLHHIFRHYLINDTILGKKLLNMKCVF